MLTDLNELLGTYRFLSLCVLIGRAHGRQKRKDGGLAKTRADCFTEAPVCKARANTNDSHGALLPESRACDTGVVQLVCAETVAERGCTPSESFGVRSFIKGPLPLHTGARTRNPNPCKRRKYPTHRSADVRHDRKTLQAPRRKKEEDSNVGAGEMSTGWRDDRTEGVSAAAAPHWTTPATSRTSPHRRHVLFLEWRERAAQRRCTVGAPHVSLSCFSVPLT